MPSELSVKDGYRLTISQRVAERPQGFVSCALCDWGETFTVPLGQVLEGGEPFATLIAEQVRRWIGHECSHPHSRRRRADVASDISAAQTEAAS